MYNIKIHKNRAVYLLELVLSMTIVGIALTSMILVFWRLSIASTPAVHQQALYIANGYLNEILTKNFPTVLPCSTAPSSRANYTNICDYNNLVDVGAKDNQGNYLTGLGSYKVSVLLDTSYASLGSLIPGTQVVRVDVIVNNYNLFMPKMIISAYKTKY